MQIEIVSPPNNSTTRRTSAKDTTQHERSSSFQGQNFSTIPETIVSQPQVTSSLYVTDPLLFPDVHYQTDTDTVLDDIFNDPAFDPEWFNIDPSVFYGNTDPSCGFISDIPNIIDEVDRGDIMQTTETNAQSALTPMSGFASFPDT